jgi:DNA (cytosine-5)-methyltransferase 1
MSVDYLAQQPTAMWNPARGVWEIPMENILCEHWGLFSETFPTSGMMRGGKLFPLLQLAHRTVESEYSLLRTPVASEAEGGAMHPDDAKAGGNTLKLGWQMLALGGHIHPKLPTPTVSDTVTDNLASSQQSDGSMHSVSLAQIVNRPDLLPTPNTMDMLPARTPEQKEANRGKGGYSNLRETVINDLLPTPIDDSKNTGHNENRRPTLASEVYDKTEWGKFAPAIHQWETITGNPAPPPTIPDGRDGQARLNPQFAEWMMGLPPGWITECDITRNEQLKACGNGVVPQQATLAITRLLQGVTL